MTRFRYIGRVFRIHRYILQEIVPPFALTIGIFVLVLTMQQGLQLIDWIVNRSVSWGAIVSLFASLLPLMMVFALPVATLIAATVAYNRLAADRELVALQSVGVSPFRLMRPAMLFAGTTALLATALLHVGDPLEGKSLRSMAVSMLRQGSSAVALDEGQFQHLPNGLILYASRIPKPDRIDGVFIFDYRQPTEPQFVVAHTGIIHTDATTDQVAISLRDGSLHRKPGATGPYQRIIFDTYTVRFTLADFVPVSTNQEQAIGPIKALYEAGEPLNTNMLNRLITHEVYRALPFSCLIFGLLAFPLGSFSQRGGRSGGFAVGLAVVALYYLLLTVSDSLGRTGHVSPPVAAWLPNMVLCAITLLLLLPVTGVRLIRYHGGPRDGTGEAIS